jgi:heme oxygenase
VTEFDPATIAAVLGHMNGDHTDDNLLIARAFGYPDATESTMTGLDAESALWRVVDPGGEHELRVPWPGGPISERAEIRREVVVLYRAACERLGIPAREEEAPAQGGHPHGAGHHGGGHPHGAGHPGGHPHAAAEDDGSFSQALREATWGDHSDSEGATFMEDIMRQRASVEDYAAMVAQHYFVYVALEEAARQLAADPRFAVFHPEALVRLPAIEADLEHLLGPAWRDRIEAVPATEDYAVRIAELAAEGWLPGIVAHHYTRYLGDLSGGQMIARAVAQQHGFDRAGVAFYDFAELGSIPTFKADYREALNALGESLDEAEKQRVIDEVRAAYGFNTRTFLDLDRARASAATA